MLMSGSAPSLVAVTPMPGTASTAVVWRASAQLRVTAVAKATFGFADEAFMPRLEPDPILTVEVHHGRSQRRSVRFTSDVAPHLARADVLFTGFAHARPGGPVRELPVRLAIQAGERTVLDKRLLVRDSSSFQRLALSYEHAWGGIDCPENPLGIGAAPGTGEPQVVDPASPRSPASFAPFGRLWPARKRLLGATPRQVVEAPVAEIPEGFDFAYFQAAPPDQRIDYLQGDEWVVLEGLHPSLPTVRMRLPKVAGMARIYGLSEAGVPEGEVLHLHADTLRIDGETQRCTLVLRAHIDVPEAALLDRLHITAGIESWGFPVVWRPPVRRSGSHATPRTEASEAGPAEPATIVDGADASPVTGPSLDLAGGGTLVLGGSGGARWNGA
jgi:hypothetical protein